MNFVFTHQKEDCSIDVVNLTTGAIIPVTEIETYGMAVGLVTSSYLYTQVPNYTRRWYITWWLTYLDADNYTRHTIHNTSYLTSGFAIINGDAKIQEWKLVSDTGTEIHWALNREGFTWDITPAKVYRERTDPNYEDAYKISYTPFGQYF